MKCLVFKQLIHESTTARQQRLEANKANNLATKRTGNLVILEIFLPPLSESLITSHKTQQASTELWLSVSYAGLSSRRQGFAFPDFQDCHFFQAPKLLGQVLQTKLVRFRQQKYKTNTTPFEGSLTIRGSVLSLKKLLCPNNYGGWFKSRRQSCYKYQLSCILLLNHFKYYLTSAN